MILSEADPVATVFQFSDARVLQVLDLEADETDRQAAIEGYIATAVGRAELFTRRRLINREVTILRTGFSSFLELPIAPVSQVSKVEYMTSDDTWVGLEASTYELDQTGEPNCLVPAQGQTWPVPFEKPGNVKITLTAGYGATGAAVPDAIKDAVLLMVANLFHSRPLPDDSDGCLGVARFLQPYVLWV